MPTFLPVPWFMRGDLRQRAQQIAIVFARHGLGWMAVQFGLGSLSPATKVQRVPEPNSSARRKQAEHLRAALEDLGGTFVKLGQMASTRQDIIPAEYAEELARLQDAAPPVPLDEILNVVREELGRSPHELFASFDAQPVASASIGQVHAAVLNDGDQVVVKVQRPGIAQQIEKDLQILSGMAEWAEAHSAFGRDYRLASLVDEFAHTIHGELDYRTEGHNADRFRANFVAEPLVTMPRIFWEYTSGRVLTMQRVSGIKISDIAALDAAGIDRRKVAQTSVRMMLREAFEFGLFHADPHPGNFFVRPDGGIVLIDFGMVGYLTPRSKRLLLGLALGLAQQDAEMVTDDLYAIGIANDPGRRASLQRDMEHMLARYTTVALKDIQAAQIMNDLLTVVFRHRLQMPGEVMLFLRLLVLSEGLGLRLDPDFQLFAFAKPYLVQFARDQRSPDALATQVAQGMINATELTLELPQRLTRLLGQVERGTLRVGLSEDNLSVIMGQFQRMVNRLALSVVLAATIMGLGLVMVAYHPPEWEPLGGWITIIAFLASLGFGAVLMWSIFRSGGQ